MDTLLNDMITAANAKILYDDSCKKILANKDIAARILKEIVPEYKDSTVDAIKLYISNIDIGKTPVDADYLPPLVNLENSEDKTLYEGTRHFDIKFTAKAPKDNNSTINLIINIEAQRKYNPGYSLIKRGIYYCCRLISSQYGTVFYKSDYDSIQKVYSIWICPNPTSKFKNTINKYFINEEALYGDSKADKKDEYDILTLIMICLDNGSVTSSNSLIELLSTIFSSNIKADDKKKILEEKFKIPMSAEINKEVEAMCNLSEDIYDKGIAEGKEELLRDIIIDRIKNNESDNDIYNTLGKYGATKEFIKKLREELY